MPEDIKANEELVELEKKIINDAKVYVYNVMNFEGEYSEEKYKDMVDKSVEKIKANEEPVFSVYEPSMMQANLTTLMQGYQFFGTAFINNLVNNDPESAKVILESVTQDWFDLQDFIKSVSSKMEEAIKQNQEKLKEETKEN